MWPWEHLAVGYLAASGLVRFRFRDRPDTGIVILVLIGTQLPDLIDKPLAWVFHVLPSGLSLGHSIFFALPVSVGVFVLARRYRYERYGLIFAVSWLSHLVTDVLYYVLTGGDLNVGVVLWPLVTTSPAGSEFVIDRIGRLFLSYMGFLSTPRGLIYLSGELLLLGSAFVLWLLDGIPGTDFLDPVRLRQLSADLTAWLR